MRQRLALLLLSYLSGRSRRDPRIGGASKMILSILRPGPARSSKPPSPVYFGEARTSGGGGVRTSTSTSTAGGPSRGRSPGRSTAGIHPLPGGQAGEPQETAAAARAGKEREQAGRHGGGRVRPPGVDQGPVGEGDRETEREEGQ